MQCRSYFPVYNSHYDLNIDANGGASPMYNDNAMFRSGHYNEYVVAPSPLPRGPSFAYKELLRQTMLFQEDTFKDQVQELHRLYRRHKELMGEIKCKDMCMNQLHLEDQSSNSTSAKFSVRYRQNTIHDQHFMNSHSTLTYTGPVGTRKCGTLNDVNFADSKGKKIRGKLLDLELPAEVYIDSDEEEYLQATPPTALFSNKRARVVVEPNVKLSAMSRSLNSVLQGELPSPCSFSPLNTNLGDLNEPPVMSGLEESGGNKMTKYCLEISEKNHDCPADESTVTSMVQSIMAKFQVGPTSSDRKLSYNVTKDSRVIQALPSLNSELSSIRDDKISGGEKVVNKINASPGGSSNSRTSRPSKNTCPEFEKSVFLSPENLDRHSIDLNSVIVSNPESTPSSNLIFIEGEAVKKRQRCRMIDINLPCDPTADDELCDLVGQINLNSGRTRLNIDLEATISPEVEERPPPRGNSEENQPEAGCDLLLELAKIAAEAIVSISSEHRIPSLKNCEASNSGNLEWFAGIISSISIDIDNGFETTSFKDARNIDDYEVMTLELTEMKVEDYWCKNTVQISTESCLMLLPCETKKGRTRSSKRKDFRKEVLPSIASLSRYEVTADIQKIEGLMEAAGTPWQLSRTRRACRMGRKSQVTKQQMTVDESPDLIAVMSWGKVNKRCRGQRSSASPSILSKWLEFGI